MATSSIEWTDMTWNPTTGCDKVSAGCKFCYAEVMTRRLKGMGQEKYKDGFVFKMHLDSLNIPFTWKRPQKVFVNSMSDLFHKDVSLEFVQKVFHVMNNTPQHIYQVLTKRDEVLSKFSEHLKFTPNIWMGVSIENKTFAPRVNRLRSVPANIRFLSIEPLIGPVGELNLSGIHWVIVGGESGPGARPMKPEWAEDVKRQCEEQNVAFFFKQWGAWGSDGVKRNKKANGRIFQGKEWNEEPNLVPAKAS